MRERVSKMERIVSFVLPPELDNRLEEICKKRKIPKSTLIREALARHIFEKFSYDDLLNAIIHSFLALVWEIYFTQTLLVALLAMHVKKGDTEMEETIRSIAKRAKENMDFIEEHLDIFEKEGLAGLKPSEIKKLFEGIKVDISGKLTFEKVKKP